MGPQAAAIMGGSQIISSLIGGLGAMAGGGPIKTEKRGRTGTQFNRNFLNEVGRYIGAPLSLGELFQIGSSFMQQSPTLRDRMGMGAPDVASFRPMTTGAPPPLSEAPFGGGPPVQMQRQAPVSLGGEQMFDPLDLQPGGARSMAAGRARRGALLRQSVTPGIGNVADMTATQHGDFGQSPLRGFGSPQEITAMYPSHRQAYFSRGGGIENAGLDALGFQPMTPGQVSDAGARDTVPTTGGRLDPLETMVKTGGKPDDQPGTDPPSDAAHGIPDGHTRRYSIADLAPVWESLDLDKFPDVERLFRKAKAAGRDVDMNDFTLQQFQELVGEMELIDPEFSARSKGNFSSALARLTDLARGEEGFDRGRGDFGPNRLAG